MLLPSMLIALALGAAGPATPAAPASAPVDARAALADFGHPSPAIARRFARLVERVREPISTADRLAAIDQIVELGPETLPLVAAELERRHRRTWAPMVYVLGASGDPRVLPILHDQLRYQTGKPYLEVLYAMSLAGDDSALMTALRSTDATLTFEPGATAIDFIAGSLGPDVVPILMREIPRRSRDARVAALRALGTLADDRAVDFLLKWSRRTNAVDRRYALIALARIGDPRAIPRVMEALIDDNVKVREAAVEALGYLRAEQAVSRLASWMTMPGRSTLKARAIWALGLIGGPEAAEALVTAVPHAEASDRLLLAHALGNTRHPKALAGLAWAIMTSEQLAATAVQGLEKLPDGEEVRELLLSACEERHAREVSLRAGLRLVRFGDPRATPCLVRTLREEIAERQTIGPFGELVLAELPLLGSESVAESLDRLAEEQTAPAIAHRLRQAARSALLVQQLGDDIDPWIDLLREGTPTEVDLAVRRLGQLGDPRAARPLTQLFGRIPPDRSVAIPRALGMIGNDAATPFLISLLVDDLYQIPELAPSRREAAIALARYAHSRHASEALLTSFQLERGSTAVPLLAYAHMTGRKAIDELVRLKPLFFRKRGDDQVLLHERVNWAIRMLRLGRTIPIEEVRDRQ